MNQQSGQWDFQQRQRTSVTTGCAQGIVNTSHKRKCVFRHDVVNDINPAYPLHRDYEPEPRQEVAVFPSGVNAATTDAEDDDELDENANGWEDYCLVVKAPAVRLTQHAFMHTTDQKWTIDLFKVLDDINALDSAFGDTLAWARGAYAANDSFYPPRGSLQSKSFDLLFDAIPNVRQLLLTVVPIMCGDVSSSAVVVFDFVSQLLSLLQNPNI